MMKPRTALLAVAAAGILLLPSMAGASFTTVLPNANEFELEGNGPTDILNVLYGFGNLQRINDAGAETDMIWHNPNGHAEAQARFAGDSHEFGFFTGAAGGSFQSLFATNGYGYLVTGDDVFDHTVTGYIFRPAIHDLTTGKIWQSLDSGNSPVKDHMVTYRIVGNAGPNGLSNVLGNYVIAWEDRDPGDGDYNDLVLELSGVAPVPEPATLTLLGLGFGAMGLVTRIRRKRS